MEKSTSFHFLCSHEGEDKGKKKQMRVQRNQTWKRERERGGGEAEVVVDLGRKDHAAGV